MFHSNGGSHCLSGGGNSSSQGTSNCFGRALCEPWLFTRMQPMRGARKSWF